MEGKVLALIENSIGPRLLLSSHLRALGYTVTVVSAPKRFRERIDAEAFDWLILDEATTRRERRRLLGELARRRGPAKIVWLGRPPRDGSVPIEALFDKPLDYREIARFFSQWAGRDAGNPSSADGVPHCNPEGYDRRPEGG